MSTVPSENSGTHGLDGRERFFFEYGSGEIGFKLIPKCGSTSVRMHLGMEELPVASAIDTFEGCKRRVLVVRHPADRLRAVYTGFSDEYGLKVVKKWQEKFKIKPGLTCDEWLDFVLEQKDDYRDWHWQSVWFQIEHVRDSITDIVALENWDSYAWLPDLPAARLNVSDPRVSQNTPHWTVEQERMIEHEYADDYDLWNQAWMHSA